MRVVSHRRLLLAGGRVLLLVFGLALGAVGCGSSSSSSSSSSAGTKGQSTASAAPSQKVTVGIDVSTMPYAGKQGDTFIGLDPEVLHAIQAELPNVKLTPIVLPFASAVPALQSGRANVSMIGGYWDNPDRRKQINLVDYYYSTEGMLVKKGNPAGVGEGAANCGKTIGIYSASPAQTQGVQAQNKKFCNGKPPIKIATFADAPTGDLAVRSGRIDGWLDGAVSVAYVAKRNPQVFQAVKNDFLPRLVYGFGVPKNNIALAYELGRGLEKARQSGELAKVLARWGIPADSQLPSITVNTKPIPSSG